MNAKKAEKMNLLTLKNTSLFFCFFVFIELFNLKSIDLIAQNASTQSSPQNYSMRDQQILEMISQTKPPKWQKPTVTNFCLLYTSPSPRDATLSRLPSSA